MINWNEILKLKISDKYLQYFLKYQNKTINEMSLLNILRILWYIKMSNQSDISYWFMNFMLKKYIITVVIF